MKKFFVPVIMIVLMIVIAVGCSQTKSVKKGTEQLQQDALDSGLLPIPLEVKVLDDNPATPEKFLLGKMLFFEPRLSKSQLISCNTCHNLAFGGDDYQETSIGHGWAKGPRNAPTVLNSVYNASQFWDGRAADLKEQAKGPIQASVEMASTPEHVVEVLNSIPEYVELFKKAFPNDPDPVTFDNLAIAIEIYEATLITPNSPFDQYLEGNMTALTAEEKDGLAIYVEQGCTSCHAGINLGGEGHFAFGVFNKPSEDILAGDKGIFALTESLDDEFAFKAPTLRNIEYTAPYFHSGKVWSLEEATAVMSSAQLGIELSDTDVIKLVAFMKTLTGDQPKVDYPILPPSTNSTPRPVWK